MVFCRDGENEQPQLSLILPHLYLGAERDVTQDALGARGISYVLSVSRCSPQPSFLPPARYLRIPIDDSLRDDLLPWIPAALRFIDGAMSSGGAVLVHCAAGISRSPALAVAYIMYSMGMDLDHAYRFVKERRPSISPNFNFLGQLQHFQGSLRHKSLDGSLVIQPLDSPDPNHSSLPASPLPSPSPGQDHQDNRLPPGVGTWTPQQMHTEEEAAATQRCSRWSEAQKSPSEATRSLSGKLQTLNLTLNLNQSMQTQCKTSSPCCEPTTAAPELPSPASSPSSLTLPTVHASLLEKRKSLTLSLSAIVFTPTPTHNKQQAATPQTEVGAAPILGHQGAQVASSATQCTERPTGGAIESAALEARSQREQSSSSSSSSSCWPAQGFPQGAGPAGRAAGGRAKGKGKRGGGCTPSQAQKPSQRTGSRKDVRRGEAVARRQRNSSSSSTTTTTMTAATIVDQQPSAEPKKTLSPLGPEEKAMEDQSPLSPLNLTINKLLGWGERMLLGVLLGPQIKMGQAALPYRC